MDAKQERSNDATRTDRRGFLSLGAMVAGLMSGYGALAAIAGRFLYPARPAVRQWMFVARSKEIALGESLLYESPSGERINITRKTEDGEASDFVALSSVCPHLGCQVHWEAQNDRYFCPCHNGIFDPEGVGTGGPPGDAGQVLPRYEVDVQNDLLYLRVGVDRLAENRQGRIIARSPGRGRVSPLATLPSNTPRGRVS